MKYQTSGPYRHGHAADALHTQRGTAQWLHQRGADFVFSVKDNQPGLFAALDALPWTDVPVAHTSTEKGHGRITRRTIQVRSAPDDLQFPHVHQVFLIERYVTNLYGTSVSNGPQRGQRVRPAAPWRGSRGPAGSSRRPPASRRRRAVEPL